VAQVIHGVAGVVVLGVVVLGVVVFVYCSVTWWYAWLPVVVWFLLVMLLSWCVLCSRGLLLVVSLVMCHEHDMWIWFGLYLLLSCVLLCRAASEGSVN